MTADLNAIAARLREAVASGSYAEAEEALAEYCMQVEECLKRTAPGAELEALALETRETLAAATHMARASRERAASQLQHMTAAEVYRPGRPLPSWNLEA
jgi:hypothetical protein